MISDNIKKFRAKMFEISDSIEEFDNIAEKLTYDENVYILNYFDNHLHDLKYSLKEIIERMEENCLTEQTD